MWPTWRGRVWGGVQSVGGGGEGVGKAGHLAAGCKTARHTPTLHSPHTVSCTNTALLLTACVTLNTDCSPPPARHRRPLARFHARCPSLPDPHPGAGSGAGGRLPPASPCARPSSPPCRTSGPARPGSATNVGCCCRNMVINIIGRPQSGRPGRQALATPGGAAPCKRREAPFLVARCGARRRARVRVCVVKRGGCPARGPPPSAPHPPLPLPSSPGSQRQPI